MKRKVVSITLVIAVLTLVFAIASFAAVPPPPVNQTLGIWDGVFNNLTEPECRECHKPQTANVNRHHILVEKGEYDCLDCHQLVWNSTLSAYVVAPPIRNCLSLGCHVQLEGQRSVHHGTTAALVDRDCKSCHGNFVDNYNDSHYIPTTYDPSLVTPWPGEGTGTNGEGGCAFCHAAGLEPPATGKAVYTNAQTHHSTGLSLPPFDVTPPAGNCLWCHDNNPGNANDIRTCEQCHGVGSLHNIQVDTPGGGTGTIVPGQEDAYYGHIGAQADCWGCHGFSSASAAAPYSGPIIPGVSGLSVNSVIEGNNTTITVTGSAFSNIVQGPDGPFLLTSNVVLTAADGSTTTLTPIIITESSMDVTIPGTLAAGNYDLRVVKGSKASNLSSIAVVPTVVISSATCSNGIATISGSGFSQNVNASVTGTVTVTTGKAKNKTTMTQTIACTVSSWSDTQITADCGSCPSSLDVSSVFGTASADLTSDGGDGSSNGHGKGLTK